MADRSSLRRSEETELIPGGCVGCESRKLGICGALHGGQLAELSRMSRRRCVSAGGGIGHGDAGDDTFGVILSGVVRLSKSLPDGRNQIVGLQFAPSFVGRPFRETGGVEARSSGPVRICVFPRGSFENLLAHSPALEHRVLAEALSQLDSTRDWLIALGKKTALERVATYLEVIASHARPELVDAEADIAMPLTRGDMADFLGLTIETVSRKMTELRKMGVIDFETASAVRIRSRNSLHHVSGN